MGQSATKKAVSKTSPRYLQPADVHERDIDLLLLEEFHASPDFQRHFLALLSGSVPSDSQFIEGRHSVSSTLGQSDLEVSFMDKRGSVWRVLVENKIYATYQPEQSERYKKRAELCKKQGIADECVTVLVAPSKYIGSADHGFDCTVTYESIRAWFAASIQLGRRQYCKLGMLDAAIAKKENASQKSERITCFWRKYYELVQEIAPELCMPAPVPRSGIFIVFKPPATSEIDFIHKTAYGNIDLQFARMGDQLDVLQRAFGPYLRLDKMKIVKANRAAVIRTIVEKLAIEDEFEPQIDAVRKTILEAKLVLEWWKENRPKWKGTIAELAKDSLRAGVG